MNGIGGKRRRGILSFIATAKTLDGLEAGFATAAPSGVAARPSPAARR